MRATLRRKQHVPRLLQRAGDAALVLGAKAGVLAGENLAGVGDPTAHQRGLGKGDLRRRRALRLLLGRGGARSGHEKGGTEGKRGSKWLERGTLSTPDRGGGN